MAQDQAGSRTARGTQRGRLRIRLGRGVRIDARVETTAGGLLAIGALTSAILLSTALLVGVATRGRRAPAAPLRLG